MRILFVTPYPPSRIRARSYGFLRHLREGHEVTILAQYSSRRELVDVEALRGDGYEVIAVPEDKRIAAVRTAMALPSALPLQVAYSRSARFTRAMQELCAQRLFDVVHVEHMRGMASAEPLIGRVPLVWDPADCITLLCKHTMAYGHSLAVRTIARVDHNRTSRYEAHIVKQLQHIIITSERDRAALIDVCHAEGHEVRSVEEMERAIEVFPVSIDLDYFQRMQMERQGGNLVFSGKMSYHANIATALYLGREIMPMIWKSRPEATLTIVGSNPPQEVRQLARDARIEVTGFVEDIRPYIARAQAVLCPMVYSVGMQFKVLEALALATPVVVAAQAARALKVVDGRDLLVASETQAYAEAALRLMDDAELHAALSNAGRVYVEQHHDVRALTRRLEAVYMRAARLIGTETQPDLESVGSR